uniref:DUF3336 domain-containing protein n=1 Tax=Macrostomum lignano TaxID=282301 RepID=A0A1I8FKX7_9PLAT
IVGAASGLGILLIIFFAVCVYIIHTSSGRQAAEKTLHQSDYAAQTSGSAGDGKLALSAQMYHYQHQKQQMLAMERQVGTCLSNSDLQRDMSDDDSDLENDEARLHSVRVPRAGHDEDVEAAASAVQRLIDLGGLRLAWCEWQQSRQAAINRMGLGVLKHVVSAGDQTLQGASRCLNRVSPVREAFVQEVSDMLGSPVALMQIVVDTSQLSSGAVDRPLGLAPAANFGTCRTLQETQSTARCIPASRGGHGAGHASAQGGPAATLHIHVVANQGQAGCAQRVPKKRERRASPQTQTQDPQLIDSMRRIPLGSAANAGGAKRRPESLAGWDAFK